MQKLTPSFDQPPALTKVSQTSAFDAFRLVARTAMMMTKKNSLLGNVINMVPAVSWGAPMLTHAGLLPKSPTGEEVSSILLQRLWPDHPQGSSLGLHAIFVVRKWDCYRQQAPGSS